jgi:hypothetical protein
MQFNVIILIIIIPERVFPTGQGTRLQDHTEIWLNFTLKVLMVESTHLCKTKTSTNEFETLILKPSKTVNIAFYAKIYGIFVALSAYLRPACRRTALAD